MIDSGLQDPQSRRTRRANVWACLSDRVPRRKDEAEWLDRFAKATASLAEALRAKADPASLN